MARTRKKRKYTKKAGKQPKLPPHLQKVFDGANMVTEGLAEAYDHNISKLNEIVIHLSHKIE